MEADDVVGQHPLEEGLADPPRQHPPAVRLRPGDVDEVVEEDVRALLADHPRGGVEVVVVEHHQRPLLALDLAEHGGGDVAVDRLVAEVPGVELLLADVRRVGEVPEVVLDEPEDRVGDHVVEAVVGLGVAADQQHPVVDPVERELGRPAALFGDGDVLVGHRRGDPERVAVGDQARERRNQAAAAAPHGALPVLVALELGRPPVRDDDQRRGVHAAKITDPARLRCRGRRAGRASRAAGAARGTRGGRAPCRRGRASCPARGRRGSRGCAGRTRRASRPGSRSRRL